MTVIAIKCKKCNETIYSRARHDFHWCSCHSCAIDGGRDYCSITGKKEDWEIVKIEINATEKQLYDDWNNRADKYGKIS